MVGSILKENKSINQKGILLNKLAKNAGKKKKKVRFGGEPILSAIDDSLNSISYNIGGENLQWGFNGCYSGGKQKTQKYKNKMRKTRKDKNKL